MSVNTTSSAPGIESLTLTDSRFKTFYISVTLFLPLQKDTVEENALLPQLLVRSCRSYPDFTALHRRLNELYGASVTGAVSRVGEAQALTFSVVSTADRLALNGEKPMSACAELLREMLFFPALENGVFRTEDVETERRCLAEEVRGQINEKRTYARDRAEQLLCQNEAYALGCYGSAEIIETLSPEQMTAAWHRVLRQATVRIQLQDETEHPEIVASFTREFAAIPDRAPLRPVTDTAARQPGLRRQTERMELNQAKLVLGFRAGCAEPSPEVSATRLMNALLGGTASSLLFRNVREKLSLCYYCSSTYHRLKGVLLIQSGVEEANAATAEREILRQIDCIRRGEFTDADLEDARRSILQSFESVNDSQSLRDAWYSTQALLDRQKTPEEIRDELESVTREQVIAAADRLSPECVYLLAPKEEARHE